MSERGAGILLHITSLPSEFGIGDLGPTAFAFADMLERSGQKFWQTLPLNFVDAGANFSPYSSVSSMAGNILLISPEMLVEDGLLDKKEMDGFRFSNTSHVDFVAVSEIKNEIFDLAWEGFKKKAAKPFQKQFKKFCDEGKDWLDDFAIYSVIKKQQGEKPWFNWPEELKKRRDGALKKILKHQEDAIDKIKFLQFIFEKQWLALKRYCNKKDIKILGDLPYYVSHDSADVWTNQELFKLDKKGNPVAVAGTPPDMFTDEGQLWSMPVFNWKILRKKNYDWWVKRMQRNRQLFNLVRLDHFRGFSAYWEVPAHDTSAKNGSWIKGPGADLFKAIKKKSGDLPFVAEDLGEIDDDVIHLREQFSLPGMKVLQFAFGENMAESEHIPHHYKTNFFVFTGTHDNNTTKGWWTNDIDEATRTRIKKYCNKDLSEETVSAEMIRLAYASVAKVAIIPMQDILNLDESARMNIPGSVQNNWSWKLLAGQLTVEVENKLRKLVELHGR